MGGQKPQNPRQIIKALSFPCISGWLRKVHAKNPEWWVETTPVTQWPCKHQAAVISGKCLKKGLAFWKIYPQCKLSYLCISSLRGALFSSPSFDLIKGHYPEEEKTHNVQSFKLLAPVHQPLLWNICSCIYFVFSLFFFPLLDLRGSHIVQVKAQTEETPGQGLCNFPTKKNALKSANFVQFQRSCLIQHWAWFWQLCDKRWEKSWGVTVGDLFKGFFCLLNTVGVI